VSCKSKLPVLDWTAAEAGKVLLKVFGHIRFLPKHLDFSKMQRPLQAVFYA
jgi:hypothetical protein